MLDRIVLSQDRKTALITFVDDEKTFTLYHSGGNVIEMVTEMILQPIELSIRTEEVTEVIEIQLSLFKEAI